MPASLRAWLSRGYFDMSGYSTSGAIDGVFLIIFLLKKKELGRLGLLVRLLLRLPLLSGLGVANSSLSSKSTHKVSEKRDVGVWVSSAIIPLCIMDLSVFRWRFFVPSSFWGARFVFGGIRVSGICVWLAFTPGLSLGVGVLALRLCRLRVSGSHAPAKSKTAVVGYTGNTETFGVLVKDLGFGDLVGKGSIRRVDHCFC